LPTLTHDALSAFAEKLLAAAGADEESSRTVAESLVGANLRGHDSHGVMRIPFYVQRVEEGRLNPCERLKVEKSAPTAFVCDGNWGFGQVLCRDLTSRLITRAKETGIACGTLRRSAHCGRLGEYAEMAAKENLVSIITANTHGAAQRVAPVGGKRPRLGTNPLCIGFPGGKDGPFVLDFGTSATAEGKVRVKKIAGEPIPLGWVIDPDGKPTTDPNQLYGDPPGTILPMGGDQAYKGFGLSFMVELLCGALSGGQCALADPPPPVGNCVFMLVIAPGQLAGIEHLGAEVSRLEEYVRGVPRIDGVSKITLPGDPERAVMAQRAESGIPLDEGNWQALVTLAERLGVELPAV